MNNEHLLKFKSEADYRKAKVSGFALPNVSSVIETGNVYINRLDCRRENAEAGDIIACHVTNPETNEYDAVAYFKPDSFNRMNGEQKQNWRPEAIVVVPLKHTTDGTVRAMALNYASLSTPSVGGNASGISWGSQGVNIPTLKDYTGAIKFSNYENQGVDGTLGVANGTYLPSDDFNAEEDKVNPFDTATSYKSTVSSNFSPSPYNNKGEINDAYRSWGEFSSVSNNCLLDMDGYENTKKILSNLDDRYINRTLLATPLSNSQSIVDFHPEWGYEEKKIEKIGDTWYDEENKPQTATEDKIGQTVKDYTKAREVINLFPAASACARYGTILKPFKFDKGLSIVENLEAGNMPWYLPSAGEVGYMIARQGMIKLGLEACGKGSGYNTDWIWSSSEYNDGSAWGLRPSGGFVSYGYKKSFVSSASVCCFLNLIPYIYISY